MRLMKKIGNKIKNIIIKQYEYLFARKYFQNINNFLYELSLRGKGIGGSFELHENGEERLVKKICENVERNNFIVFDVGANVGDYSYLLLKYNPKAKIYAFEPHPINYAALVKRLSNHYSNFRPYNIGLGSTITSIKLFDYEDNDGSPRASIYKDIIEKMYNSKSTAHEVKLETLDSLFDKENIEHIDLLKIDTEGNELEVLKGANRTLSNDKIKIIQFEFNYTHIVSRVFLRDFYNILVNYEFYRILRDGLLKIDYNVRNEIFLMQNILAINKNYLKNFLSIVKN